MKNWLLSEYKKLLQACGFTQTKKQKLQFGIIIRSLMRKTLNNINNNNY